MSPDLEYLSSYSGGISARGVPDWLTLFEIWNCHVDAWDGDGAGSCRWSLGLNKAEGVGMPLRFEISAEYMQPESLIFDELWPKQVNSTVEVPLGQWVTLDVSFVPGQGAAGHLRITLTPDGGATETVFDISGHTAYPDHPEIPLQSWQPFKLYTSDDVLDFFSTNGRRIYAYYNDVAWYRH